MVWYEFIKTITVEYWHDFRMVCLFIVSLLAVLFLEKTSIKRYVFVWYSLLVFLIIYNPITYIIGEKILEEATFEQYYLRFFSLTPILFVIAYGVTLLSNKVSGLKKLLAVMLSMAVIAGCGNLLYNEDWFTVAENRNKVPQDVVTICDIFANSPEKQIKIMAPLDVAVYLRQMDSKFSMPYSRYVNEACYELTNDNPNMENIVKYTNDKYIDYVVVGKNNVNQYLNYGFEFVGWTSNYAVIKTMDIPRWILTEYNQASGDQGMAYILRDTRNKSVIVIDGGDPTNEAQMRKEIEACGGQVDAWILTHYHQDHCSVFNSIFENPDGIKIKKVYTTNLDSEIFHQIAQEWDNVDTFDKFFEITASDERIETIQRGDKLSFPDDLEITFFNACDEIVYDNVEDIPNNDSLVFKVATPNRSMLFCADCHSGNLATYMMNEYGEDLKADILQLAHHGNNSIPIETGFYEFINPQVAIFDAPDWLLNGEQYSAKDLKQYLETHGVRTVSYQTAPNVFGF